MKKFMAILTAVVLVLSLCTFASAAVPDTAVLTVKNVTADTNLNVYQILKATTTASGSLKYEWAGADYTTAFVDAITETLGANPFGTNPSISQILLTITNNSALQINAFADKLTTKVLAAIGTATPTYTQANGTYSDTANSLTFSNVPFGYYLISDASDYTGYSASETHLILFPLIEDETIFLKTTYYTVPVKTEPIVDDTVKVGDYIPYTIQLEVPNYTSNHAYTLSVVDTFGAGLAFVNDTAHPLTVNLTDGGNTSTIDSSEYAVGFADQVLTINFGDIAAASNALNNHIGDLITITYCARVTAGADNNNLKNDVFTYENGQKVLGNGTKLYTYGFNIDKVNEYGEALAGVKFKIYTTDGTNKTYLKFTQDSTSGVYIYDAGGSAEITTPADGKLSFWGLSAGTYYIEETGTLAGYNLLANPVKVTLTFAIIEGTPTWTVTRDDTENDGNTINIVNYTGVLLPSTGGMGTTLFTFVGMGLILAAGLFLVLNRKKVFGK